MDVRGSERGSSGSVIPGSLIDGRFRVASVVSRRDGAVEVCNALDERTRQRVRLRFGPGRPDVRVLETKHVLLPAALAAGPWGAGAWVATAWFDGEPLQLPQAPMVGDDAVHLWVEALADVLDLLDRLHRTLGRAHGSIGLHSFWIGDDGRLRMMDAAAPEPQLRPAGSLWSPPEREAAPSPDPRSDLYAVAAVFYGLATARPPFGSEPAEARAGHRALRLSDHDALPPEILAVLRTAMEKQPHHRFSSAERMRAALAKAVGDWESRETVMLPPNTPAPAVVRAASAPERIPPVPYLPDAESTEGLPPALLEEEQASWETMEPAPRRTRRPAVRRASGPAVPLLVVGVVGLGLSVAAWTALVALLLGVAGA
ncbi:MAG: hypothetical protein H6735_15320 [Alphaproteobacteria bacterium]|nr:hypothetical protein [Alphaproteobacteria bacterium]